MYEHITQYVRECDTCAATKPSNIVLRAPMGDRIEAERPWQTLYVDFVGPLPRSKGGFTYMFVAVDSFTKFVHIHPMLVATAKGVIRFLEERIFLVFGVPEKIVSDNGSQFISHEYKNFLAKYQVEPFFVSRYHPQANAAEAANKTIGNAIRSYVKTDHRLWDQHVAQIACAMNTAKHTSTKMSPYFANFGREMTTSGKNITFASTDARDESHFETIRKTVEENLNRAHQASKQRYNLRSGRHCLEKNIPTIRRF